MTVAKKRHPMYEGIALLADPLYGYIQFTVPVESAPEERSEKDLIDTVWVQRLRRVHQLQSSFWVFPSGEHSRFQHSLGTMHMAGRFADRLYPSLEKVFRQCPSAAYVKALLRITGLVHDIGHGPFSHFFDHNILQPLYGTTHEGLGQRIVREKLADLIRRIRRSPELDGRFRPGETLDPEQVVYLMGKPDRDATKVPGWLRTLQAVFSGLYTADNMDYLRRDAYMTGFSLDIVDIDRLLYYTFVRPEGLTLHKSGSSALRRFINARFTMYADVYFHRTNRAMDLHMQEIFRETVQLLFPFDPCQQLDRYLGVSDWSLLEGVRQWAEDPDPRKRGLAEEWARILAREVKWKMAYDHTETMDDPRGKKFLEARDLEAAIRAALPEPLKALPFRVDMARQDPRPLNPLIEETKRVLIYDPSTEEASSQPIMDLFRYIPAQVAHYRVFALDHAHDPELAAATRRALGDPPPAIPTNI